MGQNEIQKQPPEVLLGKGALKICSKFTGEHACRSVISIKLQNNFIEITLRHRCSPEITPFPKNTSGQLLLEILVMLVEFLISH